MISGSPSPVNTSRGWVNNDILHKLLTKRLISY
nr:MAG TPA: hypothetical protein [Caudoviricetes sp.]